MKQRHAIAVRLSALSSAAPIMVAALAKQPLAQCSMCKTVIEGSDNARAAAGHLNLAILLLMIPAAVIFASFFVLLYRYRNHFYGRKSAQYSTPGAIEDHGRRSTAES